MQLSSTSRRPMEAQTPIMQAARSSAPVFLLLMSVRSSAVRGCPFPAVSQYCPPHMPSSPAASARIFAARATALLPPCRHSPSADNTV